VLIVDLDVHQGNGTAVIFEGERGVYTFSVHGAKNFPLRKARSTRDVPLPDGVSEDEYLAVVERHLVCAFNEAELMERADGSRGLDLVVYVQGVDVCADDKFGRLGISRAALAARDRRVLEEIDRRGVPGVLLLGGGYALPALPDGVGERRSAAHTLTSPELTADLHATMHRAAAELGMIGRARSVSGVGGGACAGER
jgi:acetoin utilization deacetylase AcuC-like enzyme